MIGKTSGKMNRFLVQAICVSSAFLCSYYAATPSLFQSSSKTYEDWPIYGGDSGIHYSKLTQINTSNVHNLTVAWTFDTGDSFRDSEMECNPIIIKGVLYATTPKLGIVALDAGSGKLLWKFIPPEPEASPRRFRNRGLAYWSNGQQSRLYLAVRQWLYSIDARTGSIDRAFGTDGRIDLRQGLGRDAETFNLELTSPGIVYKDLLIIGSMTSEDLPAAPGDVRAVDTRTGKLCWTFHTIPRPGEYGYSTWPADAWKHTGGVNDWAGMTLDEKRGIVFVSTGSAAFDFYGGDRHGDDLFANCLIALNAETGKRIWHFQVVRHDLWDRDLPAPATLVNLVREGRRIDAVSQTTKSGHVFVFERETGKPVFRIKYKKVPQSDVPGELSAETQPFPMMPPPFTRQVFTDDQVTDLSPAAHAMVLQRLNGLRHGVQFTPPSLQGTVIFPGTDGGAEWGGPAFDPSDGLLYVNANEVPFVFRLIERERTGQYNTARSLYQSHCASCHRLDRSGTPPEFPSLVQIGRKLSQPEIENMIRNGGGRMPTFSQLSADAIRAIANYLVTGESKEVLSEARPTGTTYLRYTMDGYGKFLDPDGYPAVKPPWGTLSAIDLNSGTIRWRIPFGEVPKIVAQGNDNTGSENYGGPVVTAGGVLFIGATTMDRKFRAYDKETGQLLWSTVLPAAANATPAVYEINGREMVVIAAGGGKWGQPSGGSYVAFSLLAGDNIPLSR